MNKNKKEKKEEVVIVRDLSLKGLLTSHLSDFKKDSKPSAVIYNGGQKSPRWGGDFNNSKIFTLKHYNTPILKVNIEKSKVDLVDLPEERKTRGLSNGDLRGINTALKVFAFTLQAKKHNGITHLLHFAV